MSTKNTAPKSEKSRNEDRDARLKAALRANLHKRKAQSRARAETDDGSQDKND